MLSYFRIIVLQIFFILEYLKRKETKRRDFETKQKAILDAKKAEEAKVNQRSKLPIYISYLWKKCCACIFVL